MNAVARRSVFLGVMLALIGAATAGLRPVHGVAASAPDLNALLPSAFGVWREARLADIVLPQETELGPGDAVAFKAYRDDAGRLLTLVIAYGPPFGDSVRLHRPETCYAAQGFLVQSKSVSHLQAGDAAIPVVRLATEGATRRESVTYWLRQGDRFTTRASEAQVASLAGLFQATSDGALVRVSTIEGGAPQFELHEAFLSSFVESLPPEGRRILLGASR